GDHVPELYDALLNTMSHIGGSRVRNGLVAGGRWIRTIGPRKINHRFETRFLSPRKGSYSPKELTLSRQGTGSSNPSRSSGESVANRFLPRGEPNGRRRAVGPSGLRWTEQTRQALPVLGGPGSGLDRRSEPLF